MGNSDSRTIFRDQIQILVNENISKDRYDYWDMLFSIPIDLSDVYLMIPDADITNLMLNRKENLFRLYDFCISLLEDVLLAELKATKSSAASNASKILVRIVPFLYLDGDSMWDSEQKSVKLLKLCLKLLFMPGYTLGDKVSAEGSLEWNTFDAARLWERGLGKTRNSGKTSAQIWKNRSDILRLILTLLSNDLYRDYNKPCQNYCGLLLSSKANELATQFLFSTLNLIISTKPLGSWRLPYSSYFKLDSQEITLKLSLQILVSVTFVKFQQFEDFLPLSRSEIREDELRQNVIVLKIAEIQRFEEIEMIYLGMKEMIEMRIVAQNTYLPGSVKEISYQHEVLLLFWTFIKYNGYFRGFVAGRADVYLMIPAIVQALGSADFLIASVSTKILVFFSTQRSIASNLFHPFPNLTTDLPLFSGCYSDFLIISLTRYVFLSNTTYCAPLFHYFLMIICNISPFLRTLCPLACNSMVRVLEKYLTKAALFESEQSHFMLFYALEAVNNVIEYQWSAASGLVLALMRKKEIICKVFVLGEKWESKEGDPVWKTKEWFEGWVKRLPIGVIAGVLRFFVPELEKFTKNNANVTDEAMLEFIKNSTLVGIIPTPASIAVRNVEMSERSEYFECMHLWTYIYLQCGRYELVPKDKIQLFRFA